MSRSKATVVIIGAGVAGVTAAAWLVQNGIDDVLVLEAQDYVGGRVKAKVVDGKNIDLGAQFIHGREGNPAYYIAKKLGILAFPEEDAGTKLQNLPREFISSKGEIISPEKANHLFQFLDEELDARFDQSFQDDDKSDGELFENVYRKFIDKYRHTFKPGDQELHDALYRWHCTYNKIDNAVSDMGVISAWGASKYKVLPGDRFTDPIGGMTAILNSIYDLVPTSKVRLNTPVKHIDWTSASGNPTGGKVLVTCENGDVIESDHVIVTISMGCMKAHHKEMFQPSLPLPVQTAFDHIGFGAIGKIYLTWDKPFWNLHGKDYFESFEFLWFDSHPITIEYDKCEKKTKFGKPWWYGIFSMETVYDHPNMLELWLTEDQVEVVEELDDAQVLAVCWELIRTFLKHFEVPEPKEIYRTKWLTNPYTLGTYSYPACSLRRKDLEHLGKPLPSDQNPRVLFAGEAYRIDFMSTFHGALLTGQSQADLLLQNYGIQTSRSLLDLIKPPSSVDKATPQHAHSKI